MKSYRMRHILFPIMILLSIFTIFSICAAPKKEKSTLAKDLKKDYYISKITDGKTDIAAKLSLLDSLVRLKTLRPGEFLDHRVNIYISSGHYQDAISLLSDVRLNCKFNRDTTLYVLYALSYCHLVTGNYDKALDCIYDIITDKKRGTEYTFYDLQADYLLANIYRKSADSHRSDSTLNHAFSIIPHITADEEKHKQMLHEWYLERADASMSEGNYEDALKNIQKASDLKLDEDWRLGEINCLAEIYHKIGENDIAEEYYIDYLNKVEQSAERIYAANNYCMLLKETGRLEEAENLCREQLAHVEKNSMNNVKADLYETLSEILSAKKDYEGAYNAYLRFHQVKDSALWLYGSSLTNDFNARIARYEAEKEKHSGSATGLWTTVAILSFLILSCTIFIIIRRQRRISADAESETETNLASPSEKSSEQIENMNREMLSLSLKIAENERTMDSLWDVALDPDKTEAEKKQELTILRKSRDANRDIWQPFSLYFEKVHPEFFQTLYQRHPDLSRGEIRMCAFIIMHLSTKDIARITNRSVRTIESMKYRLHKKLNPPDQIQVDAYLQSLCVKTANNTPESSNERDENCFKC